jgi:hypothetical protein
VPGGPLEMPDIGGIVSHRLGTRCDYLPPYIMIPGNHEQAAQTRQGFLPASTKVFKTGGRDLSDSTWRVPDLGLLAGIDSRRFENRQDLLSNLDVAVATSAQPVESLQALRDQAVEMLTNPAASSAFNLAEEPDAIREQYGTGHRGQCYLLGRRLIERGVRFVTVDVREPLTDKTPGGFNMNWDHHDLIYTEGSCGTVRDKAGGEGRYGIGHWVMMGSTDQAFAALIADLDQRGLLDDVLVIAMGEFGRTPQIGTQGSTDGRNHWPEVMSISLAGGGFRHGQVIGATERDGGHIKERPVTPGDLAATIYHHMEVPLNATNQDHNGRPRFIVENGEPIREII